MFVPITLGIAQNIKEIFVSHLRTIIQFSTEVTSSTNEWSSDICSAKAERFQFNEYNLYEDEK